MTDPEDDGPAFIRARTAAGLLIYLLVVALAIIDASTVDYQLDSIQLGLMLGTGGVLLGVEPLRRLLK
jgi:hypothetical protein